MILSETSSSMVLSLDSSFDTCVVSWKVELEFIGQGDTSIHT